MIRNLTETLIAGVAIASLGFACLAQGQDCCNPSNDKTEQAAAQADQKGIQRATIVVDNGYKPAAIKVKVGRPVRLTFVGKSLGCGDELVFKSMNIRKTLAQGKNTIVAFTPRKKGTYAFTCGMGMYKGSVVVK